MSIVTIDARQAAMNGLYVVDSMIQAAETRRNEPTMDSVLAMVRGADAWWFAGLREIVTPVSAPDRDPMDGPMRYTRGGMPAWMCTLQRMSTTRHAPVHGTGATPALAALYALRKALMADADAGGVAA